MERAQIFYYESGAKTLLLDVMFNPETYSVDSDVSYEDDSDMAAKGMSFPRFIKVNPRTLSLELFFDSDNGGSTISLAQDMAEGFMGAKGLADKAKGVVNAYNKNKDVSQYAKKLSMLVKIDPDLGIPPIAAFVWGKFTFNGVVTKLSEKNTLFSSNGAPIRSTINITFREVDDRIIGVSMNTGMLMNQAADMLESNATVNLSQVASAIIKTAGLTAAAVNKLAD